MLLRALLVLSTVLLASAPTEAHADEVRGVVAAGGQVAHVFDVDMHAAQIEVGLVTRGRRFGFVLMPEVDLGSTSAGLRSRRVALTLAGEMTFGRFGFGVGILPVYDWLGPGRAIGLGLTMFAHADVVKIDGDRALFVMLRGDVTTMHGLGGAGEDPGVWSGSLGGGIRF